MKIGVRRARSTREAAETTANEADVGEIDVAVDDVGDDVAHSFAPQGISHCDQGMQCGALGGGKAHGLLERKLNPIAGGGETIAHLGASKRGKVPGLCCSAHRRVASGRRRRRAIKMYRTREAARSQNLGVYRPGRTEATTPATEVQFACGTA